MSTAAAVGRNRWARTLQDTEYTCLWASADGSFNKS